MFGSIVFASNVLNLSSFVATLNHSSQNIGRIHNIHYISEKKTIITVGLRQLLSQERLRHHITISGQLFVPVQNQLLFLA